MSANQTFHKKIRQLIANDELKEAIHLLQELLQNSPKLNEAILQSARLNDVSRQIQLGIIEYDQANLTKNQIRKGVLDLLDEVDAKQTVVPEAWKEVERYVTLNISGKNIVAGNVTAGRDVVFGDTTHILESKTSRWLKLFLYIFVPLLVIIATFLWYKYQQMHQLLFLTVTLDNRTPNPNLSYERGSLTLLYGGIAHELPIENKVTFPGIPVSFRDKKIVLHFESPGFQSIDTSFLFIENHFVLPIRRDNSLGLIQGIVKDRSGEKFIGGAMIIISNHSTAYTDSIGFFCLQISPDKQDNTYLLTVKKEGFNTKNEYFKPKAGPIEIRLEKK